MRHHCSKPRPTQTRWNDWGHGRIEPMDYSDKNGAGWMLLIGIVGMVVAVGVLVL